jgi:hypothetical protein
MENGCKMKTFDRIAWASVLLAAAAALLVVGCGAPAFATRQDVAPVVAPVAVTNLPAAPGLPPVVSFVIVTNWATNQVVELSPAWQRAFEVGQVVAHQAPAPAGPAIELALGALAAVLGLVARAKTKRLQEKDAALSAMVAGVERAPDAKLTVAQAAAVAGVSALVHREVKART